MANQLEIYNKYFVENNFERLELFKQLKKQFQIKSALYMGSFVHVTPAFVFPHTVFVDSDRRVKKFFEDKAVLEYVEKHKEYDENPNITAFQQNYEKPLPLKTESFDLLISQYAGFVSQAGKKFLKKNGILLVNSSHGDAEMAHLDSGYEFVGAANHAKNSWTIKQTDLDTYFQPKKGIHPTIDHLKSTMKGIGYTKAASNYIFRRVS